MPALYRSLFEPRGNFEGVVGGERGGPSCQAAWRVVALVVGSGSDVSEEPTDQDVEPVTLESESFLFCPPGPIDTSVLWAGVGDGASIDDVREPAFQSPDCFFGGVALSDFTVVERASWRVASE
ncbi:MAG: hypothetical protein ACJAR2_001879 [Ilumatobacter sp.]|jgi:hypothetical protein